MREFVVLGDRQIEAPSPGKGPVRLLSLEGHWVDGRGLKELSRILGEGLIRRRGERAFQ
jgi:hypothetical protein